MHEAAVSSTALLGREPWPLLCSPGLGTWVLEATSVGTPVAVFPLSQHFLSSVQRPWKLRLAHTPHLRCRAHACRAHAGAESRCGGLGEMPSVLESGL